MEKIFKISSENKYQKNYNIQIISSPIKSGNNENILNNFLKDRYNPHQLKKRPNIQINQKSNDSKTDSIFGNHYFEKSNKYYNINLKNDSQFYENYFISIASTLSRKNKNKNTFDKNKKFTILNPFRERSTSPSNKSLVIPKKESQISFLKNSKFFNININSLKSNNNSFITEESDKKIKRNKTLYIRKHFSKDKYLKKKIKLEHNQTINQSNLNKNQKANIEYDEIAHHYYKSNIKSIPRSNSSFTIRNKNIQNNKNRNMNTNNINSNVNIYNFEMQYSNTPNNFLKNSKFYNPYLKNYLPNTLNNEIDLNNINNLISIINNKSINNNSNNTTIIKLCPDEEEDNENGKMENHLFEQSAIIIQSVFRGCLIRSQINNLLKAFKAIEFLELFFKYKFWKYFKNILMSVRSNYINNDIDSKMSISSISCISALFNSNKNNVLKTFNSKLLCKEKSESFYIINQINNKYLDTFQNINNTEFGKNKTLIWNKKKIHKNNFNSNIINQKLTSKNMIDYDKIDLSISNIREKNLKILLIKKINSTKLYLLKNFMKFYFKGILFNMKEKNIKNKNKFENKLNNDKIKIEKLKLIIEKKGQKPIKILYNFFYKFYFRCLLRFMENNRYYMIYGGRLKDINSNPLFIYESNKILKKNNTIENNNQVRNMKITLEKIRILRKILYKKRTIKKDEIKFYFYKFHLKGIIHYMKKELKKRMIIKILSLENIKRENGLIKNKKNNNKNGDNGIEFKRIKMLKRLIYKNNKLYINICKNVFDKWNLRTKIFSIIAIDKEKKKKRRIKKRNNKKLGTNNILNNPNNNNSPNKINTNNNINNISNINKKINNNSSCSNSTINLDNKINKIIHTNFIIDHKNFVISSNNIKIDYYKLNKFINKIYGVITKKFYFFSLVFNKNRFNKKIDENLEEKDKNNDDIDFFIDDSSDGSIY